MPGSKVEKVTKAEAARRLGVSPRTIDRRIAAGQLRTEDVPVRGSRDKTRTCVVLDAKTARKAAQNPTTGAELVAAQERIRSLEDIIEVLEETLRTQQEHHRQLLEVMPDLPQLAHAYKRIRELEALIEDLVGMRQETATREERLIETMRSSNGIVVGPANGRNGEAPAVPQRPHSRWQFWK